MATLAHHFQEGGFPMYGILCCSMFGNPIAFAALVVALVSKRKPVVAGVGGAALAFGVITLGIGIAGYLYSMSVVDSVLAVVDPEMREMMRARGQAEAMNNLYFGIGAAFLPLAIGGLALVRGLMLPAAEAERA